MLAHKRLLHALLHFPFENARKSSCKFLMSLKLHVRPIPSLVFNVDILTLPSVPKRGRNLKMPVSNIVKYNPMLLSFDFEKSHFAF